MGLSRLNNFLKSTRGTVLYVDPNSLDATDSIQNQGNSLTRPFKTIQRALAEAARFSYQSGQNNNDRFSKTTIVLYPGDHVVDNRPGWIPTAAGTFRLRSGATSSDLTQWDLNTVFDVNSADNESYKINSIHGGVIVPRGTSIVGMDLRKTRIRPKYVPNPVNDNIERSAVFRITGGCYFSQFTVLDADPNGNCFKDYTTNTFVPNFSHHKLSVFEYVDGTNTVDIDDTFLTYESADRTDLDMYYEKIGICYGPSSGREITPDYPSTSRDIEPIIDEYRIVGSKGSEVGITSIKAGNGVTPSTTVTVTLQQASSEFAVDTPITISGIAASGYDGKFVVASVTSDTEFTYVVQSAPATALPATGGATVNVTVDTVTSSSPYISNVSSRSVYGMCGVLADGNKASGFKSMLVSQYTGIGLQKDDNAFVKYDSTTGLYADSTTIQNLSSDSQAVYKPTYENFHIKATNDAYVQVESVFAIGYAKHFVTESGGELSVSNSSSNFGSRALSAEGFKKDAFSRDDNGYITHILTPQENETDEVNVSFLSLDATNTISIGSTYRLYFSGKTSEIDPIESVIDGYRIGAKPNDRLYLSVTSGAAVTEYSARIVMPGIGTYTNYSYDKSFFVGRSSAGINSVSSNTFTLTSSHQFTEGESVRVISENGHLPDGLDANRVYYAITSGLNSDQVQVAKTLADATGGNEVTINSKGGILQIVSRVSDKKSGDIGHPVGFDTTNSQWYVNVAAASTENSIYSLLGSAGYTATVTPKTFVKRNPDTRDVLDTVYKVRYVIPRDTPSIARAPQKGFVIQESNDTLGASNTEIGKYFVISGSQTLSNTLELRNPRFISTCSYSSGIATVITEMPHNLTVGSQVEILQVKSANNTTGIANSMFNGTFTVTGISSTKHFTFALSDDPGAFQNDVNVRNTSLPYFKRKKTNKTFRIYDSTQIQKYEQNVQDGIYHLTVVENSVSPTVSPFTGYKLSQPITNLYPQTNRDVVDSDPDAAKSFAVPNTIGKVVINDPQKSLTKRTIQNNLIDYKVGFGVTDIHSGAATTHTIFTSTDHGLAGITSVTIEGNGGSGYVAGTYYNVRLESVGIGTTLGANATAVVTVGGGGTVTAVKIMDGGSAYHVGQGVNLTGIGTVGAGATVKVQSIYNPVGEGLEIIGVSSANYAGYNNLYKILEIKNPKEIYVQSSVGVANAVISPLSLGSTAVVDAQVIPTGKVVGVSTFLYSDTDFTGIATFSGGHGFKKGNKIRITGALNTLYNDDFIIQETFTDSVTGVSTSFSITGLGTTAPSVGTGLEVYGFALTSNAGSLSKEKERTSGRAVYQYAGITTTVAVNISATASEATAIQINNSGILGLKIGDYFMINDEIFKVKTTPDANLIYAFRGVLGTVRQAHKAGDIVKRIKAIPVELRRGSTLRASGHTFEYLGYGSGNYSAGLPDKQNRTLSEQEILFAQSINLDGGKSIYSGIDDEGNFYTGNKKVNSATGEERVFGSPIPTFTGQDLDTGNLNIGFDVLTPDEINVGRTIHISGGPENDLVSEFHGPIVLHEKLTSDSIDGIESKSISLQVSSGVSRNISFATSIPTSPGNHGDVVFHANPTNAGTVGWVYTTNNEWKTFGTISS